MPSYSIPKEFLRGFSLIQSLPEDGFNKVSDSLKGIKVGARREAFFEAVNQVIPDVDEAEVIALSIFSMGRLVSFDDASIEKISDGLAKAFYWQYKKEDSSGDGKTELAKRLFQILNSWTSAKKTFKAMRLLGHNERVYRNGNIVSDIRLIFDNDLGNKNRQALIVHQLKLDYLSGNNEMNEFFITLDNRNLQKLKEQINRAIEKEQQIKEGYNEIDFISLED